MSIADTAEKHHRLRHLSVRVPGTTYEAVELVQRREGMRHLTDAANYVLEKGLDALANERRGLHRTEARVEQVHHMVAGIVGLLNMVHKPDQETLDAVREKVLATVELRFRRSGRSG
jgi:hypothetical protein